jgi:nicotinamide phosphoribosyltransferase
MDYNPLHLIDFYKVDHRRQYPEGTSLVFSNFTPRKSRIEGVNHVIFFGLQYLIKEYLINQWNRNFFEKDKDKVLRAYRRRLDTSLGKDTVPIDHIAALHDLNYLPLKIMALREGSKVPIGVPPMVQWNTHPDHAWITNYLEPMQSAVLWQPSVSATIAQEYKKLFDHYNNLTTGDTSFTKFQGHDFSFRGMSSIESACLSGAGHLLSFLGTDNVPAIDFLERYYYANADKSPIGMSVPATEHSVMCMGMKDGEQETFRRLIQDVYPEGIISIVSDTWDLWEVLTKYMPNLKATVMERDGKVVIRPDSGDPVDILCGTHKPTDITTEPGGIRNRTSVEIGVIELLWNVFGGIVTEQGYKVLDPHVGTIYGDSISLGRAREICKRLMDKGFASTNWVAGIGSFTYQYNTRDTQGWAMKATYGEVMEAREDMGSGRIAVGREIFKDPITDDGTKKSAKGLIAVYDNGAAYYMKDQASWDDVLNCEYETVFENSILVREQTLDEIRGIVA